MLGYPPPDVDGTRSVLRASGMPEAQLGNWYRIEDPADAGPRLAFQRVPEPKAVKNRMHLDVWAVDGRLDAEVERLLSLGASQVERVTDESGTFVVMQDPEGNEFCVG